MVKAEEMAKEVVGRLNAIIDMREAVEVVAGVILAAQREAEFRATERCAAEADEFGYEGLAGTIRALPSEYEETCPTG